MGLLLQEAKLLTSRVPSDLPGTDTTGKPSHRVLGGLTQALSSDLGCLQDGKVPEKPLQNKEPTWLKLFCRDAAQSSPPAKHQKAKGRNSSSSICLHCLGDTLGPPPSPPQGPGSVCTAGKGMGQGGEGFTEPAARQLPEVVTLHRKPPTFCSS